MTKPIPLSRAAAPVVAVLGTCLLAFACPAAAFTASGSKPGGENTPLSLSPSSTSSHSSSGGASLVRTIVGLAIVIAVIWGLTWILRQVKSGRDPQVSSAGLASVAALTLGTGRSVHLVRAGNEYHLLASAEHGLLPIHRYSEQEAEEAGLLDLAQPSEGLRQKLFGEAQRGGPIADSGPMSANSPASRDHPAAYSSPATYNSPAAHHRPDPMRASGISPAPNLVERLRQWTVRR